MTDTNREWTGWFFEDQSTLHGKFWVYHSGTWDSVVELEEWPHMLVSSCWSVCYMPWRDGNTVESLPPVPERFR